MKVRHFAITSSALRHLCNSIRALVLSVTSSLRRKNGKAVDFYSLRNNQPEDANSPAAAPMNSWLKVFLLELQHRGYSTREMQELHKNIQPFIAYLEYVNQHGITGLEPEHVQVYVAKEKATLHTASTSHDILAINKRIAAVKMFCLQMVIAGKISYDYAISIDLLPLPAILAAHKKYPL